MSYVCDDDIVGVCEKQIMELEVENDQLKAEIVQLKNDLRITREGRHFFYQDAKAYHNLAMRLQKENSDLRAQLATHTNPEDTYRDDFGNVFIDETDIIDETFRRC